MESDYKLLRQQYDTALATGAERINLRYKDMLEALLRRAIQAGSLESALVLKKQLEDAWSELPFPKILGDTHWTAANGGTILLKADKNVVTSWGHPGGTWKFLGSNKLIILFPGIETWAINPSHDFVTDQNGTRWNRAK